MGGGKHTKKMGKIKIASEKKHRGTPETGEGFLKEEDMRRQERKKKT